MIDMAGNQQLLTGMGEVFLESDSQKRRAEAVASGELRVVRLTATVEGILCLEA
jgi:hypothetical protein